MVNEKYSNQDFSGQTFLDVDPSEFSNTTISNSSFYQQNFTGLSQWYQVFPVGAENVEFLGCNLDNVQLPLNSTIDNWSTNKQFIFTEIGDVEV